MDTGASYQTLMEQAGMTINTYLRSVVKSIDDVFGKGYAKNNPDLVGKLVECAARDYDTSVSIKSWEEIMTEATDKIAHKISEALLLFSDDQE